MPIGRDKLDEATARGCELPGCTHEGHPDEKTLYLHARCHVKGRGEVSYTHGSGVLRVGCLECGETIAEVIVGEGK